MSGRVDTLLLVPLLLVLAVIITSGSVVLNIFELMLAKMELLAKVELFTLVLNGAMVVKLAIPEDVEEIEIPTSEVVISDKLVTEPFMLDSLELSFKDTYGAVYVVIGAVITEEALKILEPIIVVSFIFKLGILAPVDTKVVTGLVTFNMVEVTLQLKRDALELLARVEMTTVVLLFWRLEKISVFVNAKLVVTFC